MKIKYRNLQVYLSNSFSVWYLRLFINNLKRNYIVHCQVANRTSIRISIMQTSMLAAGRIALPKATECSSVTSSLVSQHKGLYKLPSLRQFRHNVGMRCSAVQQKKLAKRMEIVATYPEPETEKERSPIDFPQVSRF